jgi:hypothetical protein
MEVHHHSHPPSTDTHRRRNKWAHYFYEFFMLFLAVLAGFFVENQREHYIEHQRAKQYARALYSDLISDTSTLANNIRTIKDIILSQDRMLDLMKKIDTAKIPGATLYHYAAQSEGGTFFSVKTATLQQLKNSGSLRYFKSFELVRLINEYDQALANQFSRSDVDHAFNSEYRMAFRELFSFEGTDKVNELISLYPEFMDSIMRLDIPVLQYDAKQKSNYMHALKNRQYNLSRRVEKYYSEPLEAAQRLILALKEEYHF